jgi:hypothetical protein
LNGTQRLDVLDVQRTGGRSDELLCVAFPGLAERIERYGAGEAGPAGTVKKAPLELCEDEAELDAAFARLAQGGQVLMPLDNYGFSKKFGWTNDRFGVSWQFNLS